MLATFGDLGADVGRIDYRHTGRYVGGGLGVKVCRCRVNLGVSWLPFEEVGLCEDVGADDDGFTGDQDASGELWARFGQGFGFVVEWAT